MSKGKIEIIETCCRRCGKTIRTLSHSIIGADAAREKFGSICGDCITPEEDNELTEMLRQLYRMINQLGQLDKSIVLLYLEEKSYEEIAEITGLTVTNVATKLSRIKDKLKKMKKEE